MKVKYKKMIIMVTMCTMGIGLVAFSMVKPKVKQTTTVEEANTMVALNATEENASSEADASLNTDETVATFMKAEAIEVVLEDTNKKVNSLIKKYLDAKLSGDVAKFKTLVNDTKLLDIDEIGRKTKYIESYKNVKSYTVNGPEEGSFIVYAYHEVKFSGIDTLAPAMNEFYVTSDSDGNLQIYLGEINEETEAYFDEVRNSDEVMELIYNVNDALENAVKEDIALGEFYLKLEESTKDVSMNE